MTERYLEGFAVGQTFGSGRLRIARGPFQTEGNSLRLG
jgi:hypothetical protein